MLSNFRIDPFKRTNARGTDTGLRITWDSSVRGEEVFISYNLNRTRFIPTAGRQTAWELLPAEPGSYEFHVFSQEPGASVRSYGFVPYTFDGLAPSEQDLTRPTGLELVGVDGELLGSARTFEGRDLRIRWNSLRMDALQTDLLGVAPLDHLLESAVVRVVNPEDGRQLRIEYLPIGRTDWVYTYAHATEDIPLTTDPASVVRDLRIEVAFWDAAGRTGDASVLEVEWTLRLTNTPDLEDDAVQTAKLADSAVETAKLANLAVATGKIANDAVETAKIANSAVATAKIAVAATKEFASFTKSSSFAVLDTDAETETYGPATMTVFDANAVVGTEIRINFDMGATFPADADTNTKNQLFFEALRRPVAGADTVIDTFSYDMHINYPFAGATTGRISIPTFTVKDTPGAGTFEYRVRVSLNIAQGGASAPPSLTFQGVLLNLEVEQSKR